MTVLRIALLVDPLTALVKGARHAIELGDELQRRGHSVRTFGVPKALFGREPAEEGASARERFGRTTVLGFRPQAIVAYDALSPVAMLGARIARHQALPLVLVEDGRMADGNLVRRTMWRVGERLWGRTVRRTVGSLVALDPVARAHAESEGFDAQTVQVVPHGVDVDRYRPGLASPLVAKHRIRGRILLHAGSQEPYAGLELLINAFARTVGQRGDWSLVLAGRRGVPPRLRACAHRNGVAARVHFLRVLEADLPALFSSATLVAQPAREDRSSGLSLLWAMASGVPVVASDLPRLAHLVEAEGSGLLAPAGDFQAWSQALQRAASSPEARKRWGRRGRELAHEHYAWGRLGSDWEAVLATARARVPELGLRGAGAEA